MRKFQLLRAVVRSNLTLTLAGDKLLVDGNLRLCGKKVCCASPTFIPLRM